MKRSIAALAIAAVALTGSVSAHHPHYLDTPGTCVEDLGNGQTSKSEGEGGYHRFHGNVHLGTPGTFGFAKAEKVSVGKGQCPAE